MTAVVQRPNLTTIDMPKESWALQGAGGSLLILTVLRFRTNSFKRRAFHVFLFTSLSTICTNAIVLIVLDVKFGVRKGTIARYSPRFSLVVGC